MMKADVRRKKLREAAIGWRRHGQISARKAACFPSAVTPLCTRPARQTMCSTGSITISPSDYWTSQDVSRTVERISVPALHVSGWYDTYLRGSIDGFLALRANAGTDFARQHQYLIAGPWQHIPWGDRLGATDFGTEALIDTDEILLRWFNHWLKDSGEFKDEPHIRHFVLWAK